MSKNTLFSLENHQHPRNIEEATQKISTKCPRIQGYLKNINNATHSSLKSHLDLIGLLKFQSKFQLAIIYFARHIAMDMINKLTVMDD